MLDTRVVRKALALATTLLVVLCSPSARAEPTSWLALGPGLGESYDHLDHQQSGVTFAISAELGLGTDSRNPFVIGGVFRTLTFTEYGTDVSLAARLATSGFARGYWGLAFDLGVGARWWGRGEYGHYPIQPVAIFGFPRGGIQIEVGAQIGDVTGESPVTAGGFILFAADIFRLLTRQTGATSGASASSLLPPCPPQSTTTPRPSRPP